MKNVRDKTASVHFNKVLLITPIQLYWLVVHILCMHLLFSYNRNVKRTNKKADELSKRQNDIAIEERSLTMHFKDMDKF